MPATSPFPFTPAEAESLTADEIVAAAITAFHPGIALACSFQQEEAVLAGRVTEQDRAAREALMATEAFANREDDLPTWRYIATLPYWKGRAQENLGIGTAAQQSYRDYLAIRPHGGPLADDARERIQ